MSWQITNYVDTVTNPYIFPQLKNTNILINIQYTNIKLAKPYDNDVMTDD